MEFQTERSGLEDKTVENVLDTRTSMTLFKYLIKKNIKIGGCISTGKEASVYHASGKDLLKSNEDDESGKLEKRHYAVKIFKTFTSSFKNREKYVTGDHKSRNAYGKKNTRKMIENWAEKEMSNLKKLYAYGLPVPKPIMRKSNVLVMDYLGTSLLPAPRLKDAKLSESKLRELYLDLVNIVWIMYRKCKLVHADLSEYNMLYHKGQVYIIDVSQSVDLSHPHSIEFLVKDCCCITDFFRKRGVSTLTLSEFLYHIADSDVTEENREKRLDILQEVVSERGPLTRRQKMDEESFKNIFINKTMIQDADFESNLNFLQGDDETEEDILFRKLLNLKEDTISEEMELLQIDEEEEFSEDEENENCTSKEDRRPQGRPKGETAQEKKLRKQKAKAEKRKSKN